MSQPQIELCVWCDRPLESDQSMVRLASGAAYHMDPCRSLALEEQVRKLESALAAERDRADRAQAERDDFDKAFNDAMLALAAAQADTLRLREALERLIREVTWDRMGPNGSSALVAARAALAASAEKRAET